MPASLSSGKPGPGPPGGGLASRLIHAVSESEFSATIGELKRQMDRQSRVFLRPKSAVVEDPGVHLGAKTSPVGVLLSGPGAGGGPDKLARRLAGILDTYPYGGKVPASVARPRPAAAGRAQGAPRKQLLRAAESAESAESGQGDHRVPVEPLDADRAPPVRREGTFVCEKREVDDHAPARPAVGESPSRSRPSDGLARKGSFRSAGEESSPMTPRSRVIPRPAPTSRSMASWSRPRPPKTGVPSQRTFIVTPNTPRRRGHQGRRQPLLLDLPPVVLVRVFGFLGPRERTLPVSRRWVDVGSDAALWRTLSVGGRGPTEAVCRRLRSAPSLERLEIADRKDVNTLLSVAFEACPVLRDLVLARCTGPGDVHLKGASVSTLRSLQIRDSSVSGLFANYLAEHCARTQECMVPISVNQATSFFGFLLRLALTSSASSASPVSTPKQQKQNPLSEEALRKLNAVFSSSKEDPDKQGMLAWRRKGQIGVMSFNNVSLSATLN